MLSNKVIKNVIEDLKIISKVDLCVVNINGEICATTFKVNNISKDYIIDFFNSMVEMQSISEYNFFKVIDDISSNYVVITKGNSEDCYIMGKICVSQLKNLIVAYREKLDENGFIQNLLLDNMLLVDIYNRAKKLDIENNANRVVMIVKAYDDKDSSSLEMIKNIFAENNRDYITAVNEKSIIIIKDIGEDISYEEVEKVANILVDMFNTEIMVKAKVAYGTIVNDLKYISKSYKEAKMSMEVGDIFYNGRNIIGYNTLGIGRLIYQLPVNLCKMFMNEIFKENLPDTFDEETITTIYKFFENNLNISETARKLYIHRNTLVYRLEKIEKTTGLDIRVFDDALTFKLALMVVNYMKHVDNR
ncbi:helix-turn-helix domain-containing protein [uncultured Tyzzerella sp.]|uniref:PucR family transcriptional regulator n=1 Tax=uncultured Tyzzerella sp. TaxID=2321398 RepID=UPI002942ABA1|nr:helix-turn-helix domain-containing protein [uncultured Tyzzerella sp.]